MSLGERPDVDRAAVANQVEQAWFVELAGGPLVQTLQPWDDDRVIEEAPKALFVGDVELDVVLERVPVREHATE